MMKRLISIVTIVLSAIMCVLGFGMLVGLLSFWTNPNSHAFTRFLPVALFPFIWASLVAFLSRKNRGNPVLSALTFVVFVAFIGAVDFANGRPLYSSLTHLW